MCFSKLVYLFSEAVVAIEKVAEHINEMQRITEQFSPVFHQLIDECEGFEVKQMIVKIGETGIFISFLTRGYAKRRNGFLLGLRYANVSLAHSGVESS